MFEQIDRFFSHIHQIAGQLEQYHTRETGLPDASEVAEWHQALQLTIESLYTAESELRQQQEQILESQQSAAIERLRYYELFNNAPDAYLVTDVFGVIQEANRAAVDLFNLPIPYLKGKPLAVFVEQSQRRDFRILLHTLAHTLTASIQEREFTLQSHRHPTPTATEIRVVPILDRQQIATGYRWLIRDITLRQYYQSEMQSTNEMLQSLVNASPLAIISLGYEGEVRLWNKTAERLFGWIQAEAVGQPPPSIIATTLQPFWKHCIAILEGKTDHIEVETTYIQKDEQTLPVHLSAGPICDESNTTLGIILLIADLTEAHQHRAELRAIKTHLTTLRDVERRRFAQQLHDDVIQQLAGLQFQLVHARHSINPVKPPTTLTDVEHGLEFIGDEMGAIIRLVRSMTNDLSMPGLENFGFIPALNDYVAQLQRVWSPPVPTIEVVLPKTALDVPILLANVLLRVLQEALRNIRYHASAQHVLIEVMSNAATISLCVQDDGKGFERPLRLTTLAQTGHFGLLEMTEQAESVGGMVEVISQPGDGTTILVSLPWRAGVMATAADGAASPD